MLIFPPMLLREQSSNIRLVSNVVAGGPSQSGIVPMISRDGGGLWRIDYSGISLKTRQHVLAYRAIATALDSGATPIIVPICETRFAPYPPGAKPATGFGIPYSDGALHDDGAGFAQPVIVAEADATAILRATTLDIDATYMAPLQGGEYFSIRHATMDDRLYQIVAVTSVIGSVSSVTIRPPLREAVAAGTPLEFEQPRIVAQLAAPDAGSFELQLRKFGTASPSFVEAFPAAA